MRHAVSFCTQRAYVVLIDAGKRRTTTAGIERMPAPADARLDLSLEFRGSNKCVGVEYMRLDDPCSGRYISSGAP